MSLKKNLYSHINDYESLRHQVLLLQYSELKEQLDYILFIERGMLTWAKSRVISNMPTLPAHKIKEDNKRDALDAFISVHPDIHSGFVSILSDIAFHYHLQGVNYV